MAIVLALLVDGYILGERVRLQVQQRLPKTMKVIYYTIFPSRVDGSKGFKPVAHQGESVKIIV